MRRLGLGPPSRPQINLAGGLATAAAVGMDVLLVVLGNDGHRSGRAVHDEESPTTKGDEGGAAGGLDNGTDRGIVRPQPRVLAGRAARRAAASEVERGRRIQREGVGR